MTKRIQRLLLNFCRTDFRIACFPKRNGRVTFPEARGTFSEALFIERNGHHPGPLVQSLTPEDAQARIQQGRHQKQH